MLEKLKNLKLSKRTKILMGIGATVIVAATGSYIADLNKEIATRDTIINQQRMMIDLLW